MGYYINKNSKGELLSPINKTQALIADGAKITTARFQPNLVCVVENGLFDAAGYCFSKEEFEQFNNPNDDRPKTWLIYEHAAKLSGYKS